MLYVVHKDGNEDYVCTTDTIDFHAELRKNGVSVLKESEFIPILQSGLKETDVVMIHVGLAHEVTRMGLKHFAGRKLLFTIDECKSDGILFRTHREFCDQIDCREMILSYPSKRNVEFLESHGYETIAYNPSSTVREKKEKKYDIIISGQLDPNYYPVRVHLADNILKNQTRWKVAYLPHPGFEISKATHQYTGEKYRELLDECKLGVVCRAGWRDRLVAKYVEFGSSWCLPIGDVPTYMNSNMGNAMVRVDQNTSENEIVNLIDDALENLDKKIESYVCGIRESHDLRRNVKSLVELVLDEGFRNGRRKNYRVLERT